MRIECRNIDAVLFMHYRLDVTMNFFAAQIYLNPNVDHSKPMLNICDFAVIAKQNHCDDPVSSIAASILSHDMNA